VISLSDDNGNNEKVLSLTTGEKKTETPWELGLMDILLIT